MKVTANSNNRASNLDQVLDRNTSPGRKWFSLHNNVLDGSFHLPGRAEYEMYFNKNGRIEVNDSAALSFGDEDFSVQAWVRATTQQTNAAMLTKTTAFSDLSLNYGLDQGVGTGWRFRVSPGSTSGYASSMYHYNYDGWVHLTGVYKQGGTIELYVDGILRDTVVGATPPTPNTGKLYIGSYFETRGFHGFMNDVRIWNRALSASEILDNMNERLTGYEDGLVGFWFLKDADNSLTLVGAPGNNDGVIYNANFVRTENPTRHRNDFYKGTINPITADFQNASGRINGDPALTNSENTLDIGPSNWRFGMQLAPTNEFCEVMTDGGKSGDKYLRIYESGSGQWKAALGPSLNVANMIGKWIRVSVWVRTSVVGTAHCYLLYDGTSPLTINKFADTSPDEWTLIEHTMQIPAGTSNTASPYLYGYGLVNGFTDWSDYKVEGPFDNDPGSLLEDNQIGWWGNEIAGSNGLLPVPEELTLKPGIDALSFDGIDDYVSIDRVDFSSTDEWTAEITIEGHNGATHDFFFGQDDSTTCSLDFYENYIVYRARDGSYVGHGDPNNIVDRTARNNIAVTYSEGIFTFYNNGQKLSSYAYVSEAVFNCIGNGYTSNAWVHKGRIENVRLWDRALRDEEVLYNAGNPVNDNASGLIHQWKMNESSGAIAYDNVGGNHGTVIGATWVYLPKSINTLRITGDAILNDFPVDFTVKLLDGAATLHTVNVSSNNQLDWIRALPQTYDVDSIVIAVTRVNKEGSVTKVLDAHDLYQVTRKQTLAISGDDTTLQVGNIVYSIDTAALDVIDNADPVTAVNESSDVLSLDGIDDSFFTQYEIWRNDVASLRLNEPGSIQNIFDSMDSLLTVVDEDVHMTVELNDEDNISIIKLIEDDAITAEFGSTDDIDIVGDGESDMTNIHTVMDGDTRQIHGRVEITYTDPFLDEDVTVDASTTGRGTNAFETADTKNDPSRKWFSLQENKLDGTYFPMDDNTDAYSIGWWGTVMSAADGTLYTPEWLQVNFSPRGMFEIKVVGDSALNEYPVDFDIVLKDEAGTVLLTREVRGNDQVSLLIDLGQTYNDVASSELIIYKINEPNRTVKIVEFYTALREIYESDDIISIDLLEEQNFSEMTLPIGNASANELDVSLHNENRKFDPGNESSPLFGWLKKNRRVRAWLGAEITPNVIEWYPLGTFWTQEWDAPESGIYASLTAYDRLELIRVTTFTSSQVYQNVNLYDIAEMILQDAQLAPEDYVLDEGLRNITVPYIWFGRVSHREALVKIAEAALGRVYCDRQGRINVVVFNVADYYIYDYDYDKSIIDLHRPIALSQITNKVEVSSKPRVLGQEQVVFTSIEEIVLQGNEEYTETISFTQTPVMSVLAPTIEGTFGASVQSYKTFAWGMEITYVNTYEFEATISKVEVRGRPLVVEGERVAIAEDFESIRSNGEQAYKIESDFIQSYQKASIIAQDILDTYSEPRHDATIESRGNVALTLADRVRVPTKQGTMIDHVITSQTLSWMGSLDATVKAQLLR